ncbi:MAG: hypothetical protein JWL84_5372 [Rhodospirillales bacterium]|jgi:hypothetical protein|nr:hypothetical protein [Rhodospirillales bacterium]
MTGHSTALKDRHLEQTTTMSLKREPACFAFLCSHSITAPMPIDSLNLDLASADYFEGRASLWTTLEIRSGATDDRPVAVLGFDEAFLRPFTRALIEAATTRTAFRMTIVPAATRPGRHRVVEYVTGPGEPLREIVLTPHENVVLIGAALGGDSVEETLFQLPRSDTFLRGFAKMSFQADQMLRDTLTEMERFARGRTTPAAE